MAKKTLAGKIPQIINENIIKAVKRYNNGLTKQQQQLLIINFKIGHFLINCDLNNELYINTFVPAELQEQMAQAAPKYAYWSSLLAELEEYEANEKLEYDKWYNQFFVNYLQMDEYKRGSDLRIERAVSADNGVTIGFNNKKTTVSDGYTEWKKHFVLINSAQRKVKIVVNAFERKMDMLRSIGAMVRTDLNNINLR